MQIFARLINLADDYVCGRREVNVYYNRDMKIVKFLCFHLQAPQTS